MSSVDESAAETFNPWSVVNLVFEHLSDEGLHPTLGEGGDPAAAARDLLLALSIEPAAEGNREIVRAVRAHLAEIRTAMLGEESEDVSPGGPAAGTSRRVEPGPQAAGPSQSETTTPTD